MPQEVDMDSLPDFSSPLPMRTYTAIVREVKQDPSKNTHAAQDTLECEIVAPDTVEFAGSLAQAAGREFKLYITYSAKNLANAKKALASLGYNVTGKVALPTEDEVISGSYTRVPLIQDVTAGFKGLVFDIMLATEPAYKTDNGKWNGTRVKDPEGNDIVMYHKIGMVSSDAIASKLRNTDGTDPF